MKRCVIATTVLMLVITGFVGMMSPVSAADVMPHDVMATSRTESSFMVTWTTQDDVEGYLLWDTVPGSLGNTEYDVRGSLVSDDVHMVLINGLAESDTIYYQVVSDGVQYGDDGGGGVSTSGSDWQVDTKPAPATPPTPYMIYGQVNGVSDSVLVHCYLTEGGENSDVVSNLSLADGTFTLNLGNFRRVDGFGGGAFNWAAGTTDINLRFDGGRLGTYPTDASYFVADTVDGNSPQGIGTFPWDLFETDLSITAHSVDNPRPVNNSLANITVTVDCNGPSTDAMVWFYDGDPDAGGTQIGAAKPVTVGTNATADVTSDTWTVPGQDTTVYVRVLNGSRVESSTANNEYTLFFDVFQPNLAVATGDISLEPSPAIYQRPAWFNVTIHNDGDANVTDADISFYHGPWLINTQSLGFLAYGDAKDLSQPWTPNASGSRTLRVEITNPSTDESSVADNLATRNYDVYAADAYVQASDIQFSDNDASPGDTIYINATVHNSATNVAIDDLDVRFFDGKPGSGGVQIGSTQQVAVAPGGSAMASVLWPITVGITDVYVNLTNCDPSETDVSDNEAMKSYYPKQPDLYANPSDIRFKQGVDPESDHGPILELTSTIIRATIRNSGTVAGSGWVEFYNGPVGVGFIGNETVSVAVSGQTIVETTWPSPSLGNQTVTVLITGVSPLELDDTNNEASTWVDVQENVPNLVVLPEYITSSPTSPVIEGSLVQFTVEVHNEGLKKADEAYVGFFDGVPGGGNMIGDAKKVTNIASFGSKIVSSDFWDTSLLPGLHSIYAAVLNCTPVESENGDNVSSIDVEVTEAPPVVIGTIPADGQENVPLDTDITVEFSFPMETASVETAFTIESTDGYVTKMGTYTWSGDNKTMTYHPSVGELNYDQTYTCTMEGTAKKVSGIYLDGNGDGVAEGTPGDAYEWSFSMMETPDNLGPLVITASVTPDPTGAATFVDLLVTISDDSRGDHHVWAAEYRLNSTAAPSIPMTLVNPPGDQISEQFKAKIDISSLPEGATYTIYIWGMDSKNNWGPNASTTFTKSDITPPVSGTAGAFEGVMGVTDNKTGGKLTLSWEAADDISTPITYNIYMDFSTPVSTSLPAVSYTPNGVLPGDPIILVLDNLENDRMYYFKVGAEDNEGNEDTTDVTMAGTPTDQTPPTDQDGSAFSGVMAVNNPQTGGVLEVQWNSADDANTDDAADPVGATMNYLIYWAESAAALSYMLDQNVTANYTMTNQGDVPPGTTLTYLVEGLDNGGQYFFAVRARDFEGNMDWNNVIISGSPTDTTAPFFWGITGATDQQSGGRVRVTWTATEDISSPITYNIYLATTPAGQDFMNPDESMTSSVSAGIQMTFIIEGLLNGQEYYIVVRAEDSQGNEDDNTFELSVTPTDQQDPVFNGLVSAVDTETGGAITLDWDVATDENTDPTAGPIKYNIYRTTDNPNFIPSVSNLHDTVIGVTTYDDVGLSNTQTYYYIVRAEDSEGNEDNNLDRDSDQPSDTQPPVFGGITDVVDDGYFNTLTLKWNTATDTNTDPDAGALLYNVYMANVSGQQNMSAPYETTPFENGIQITGLENGERYFFKVRAVDSSGNEDVNIIELNNTPTDFLPPDFNGVKKVVDTTKGKEVNVSWNAGTDPSDPVSYNVYASRTPDFTPNASNFQKNTENLYMVIKGLTNNETWYFKVRAVDYLNHEDENVIEKSVTPTDTTEPKFSGLVTARDQKESGLIRLTWYAATDNSGPITYKIYMDTIPNQPLTEVYATTTSTSYIVSGLENKQTYYFIVWAVDDLGNENKSTKELSAVPTDGLPPDFAGLYQAVDTQLGGEVELNWTAATDLSDDPIMYYKYRSTIDTFTPSEDNFLDTTTQLHYTDSNLTNGKAYYYIVRARDSATIPNMDQNTNHTGVTPTDQSPPTFDGIKSVDSIGTGGVLRVEWYKGDDNDNRDPNPPFRVKYDVYRGGNLTHSGLTKTYVYVEGLQNGMDYDFVVVAYDSSGNTVTSAAKTGRPYDTIPPEFDGLASVTDLEQGGKLLLEWDAAEDNNTDDTTWNADLITYEIYRSTAPSLSPVGTPIAITTLLSFTDSGQNLNPPGLVNGERYYYIVKAVDSSGNEDEQDDEVVRNAVPTETNEAPELSFDNGPKVDPENGYFDSTFTFQVTYMDENDDAPKYVYVYIGNDAFLMEDVTATGTGFYKLGVTYEYEATGLSVGTHDFRFEAMDDPDPKTTTGDAETVSTARYKFTVKPKLQPPTLSNFLVSPSSGEEGTLFVFRVTYKDVDATEAGYAPEVVVYIDDYPYTMSPSGSSWTTGVEYKYETKKLSAGDHTFYFEGKDGDNPKVTTQAKTFTVEDKVEPGTPIEQFLGQEYVGLQGKVWLFIIIFIVIAIIIVAARPAGGPAPPPGPEGITIDCPECKEKLQIKTTQRPVKIQCPKCSTQMLVK